MSGRPKAGSKNSAVDAPLTFTRSSENWFLDAATYARDGDPEQASKAALAGIRALRKLGSARA